MNNSDKYNVHVRFNQQVSGIRLQLVDGSLKTIFDGISNELNLELLQGVYQLKIFYLDYYQENFFSVTSDTELKLEFGYALTVPVLNYITTHEYYSKEAEYYSKKTTFRKEDLAPSFFLFAALYDKDKPATEKTENWLTHYTIFNIDKSLEIQLDETNSVFDNGVGKLYFSIFLKPGLYFLKYEDKDLSRIFPLYIFDEYQTQFFIRYAGQPDFKNCRFFFSKNRSFAESGIEYVILEKILCAYSNFRNFDLITGEDIQIIKNHPYLVALVNILFASVTPQIRESNKTITQVSPVKDSEELNLPDVTYCKNEQKGIYALSDKPPLLSFVIIKYTHRSDNSDLLFEPASIVDRIVDHINYDLFWNNFSIIEEPGNWAGIYRPLLQTIDNSPNLVTSTVRKIKKIINYWRPQDEDNLNHLVGKTTLNDEQIEPFNKTISKIKGVSEMSKEFGLPPTTILRNYEKYNTYFAQSKEMKSQDQTLK